MIGVHTTTYVYKSNYSSLCEYRVCHVLLVSNQIVEKADIKRCAYDQKIIFNGCKTSEAYIYIQNSQSTVPPST